MKTSKILTKALEAKNNGKKYMASVVGSCFTTTYFHLVLIDDIIKAGKWIGQTKQTLSSGAYCRPGVTSNQIDWSITVRK